MSLDANGKGQGSTLFLNQHLPSMLGDSSPHPCFSRPCWWERPWSRRRILDCCPAFGFGSTEWLWKRGGSPSKLPFPCT